MSKELAVAAVAVFAVTLVRGRGGTGAALGAAVLILHFVPLTRRLLAQRRTVHQLVPFTRLVPINTTNTHGPAIVTLRCERTKIQNETKMKRKKKVMFLDQSVVKIKFH